MKDFEDPLDRPEYFAVPSDFRFVDTHVHFFDHSVESLWWRWFGGKGEQMLDPVRPVAREGIPTNVDAWRLDAERYSVPEFAMEVSGLGVDKIVHLNSGQSEDPRAEVTWLQGLKARHGWPNAMVSGRDLNADKSIEWIEALSEYEMWRGVRQRSLGDHADAFRGENFLRAFDTLVHAGGTLFVWAMPGGFEALAELARRNPDATIVLERAGLPVMSKGDTYQAAWADGMAAVAREPNVVCQITGLSYSALPNFYTASIRDWVVRCIDVFGPGRCMFGSNFPLEKLWVSYARQLYAYRKIVADFTAAEQRQLFAETAERVYRI